MQRTEAEMRNSGPALVSRHIPPTGGGRGVTVSLRIAPNGAFVIQQALDDGQDGWHRGTPPVATTVSDIQHWALAGRHDAGSRIEVVTQRGEQVDVLYDDGVWLAIIEPFDEDLYVEVRQSKNGQEANSRTITLPHIDAPPVTSGRRGWGPFREESATGPTAAFAWFDRED
jgi:hypothetical protein